MDAELQTAVAKVSASEWSSLRKNLKNCPPFDDALDNIPQEKWLKNRKESLTQLLQLCLTDQYRNRLIDVFKNCLGDKHSVTRALRGRFIPSNAAKDTVQVYGAVVGVEQFKKEHRGMVKHSLCCTKTVCGLTSVLAIIVALAAIAMLVYVLLQISSTKLGYTDDTVLVGNPTTPWNSRLVILECLQTGDYYHRSDISVVLNSDLIVHQRSDQQSSRVFEQPRPSLITGVVDYLYLVEGSNISYGLCATNQGSSEQKGTFYIFDNREDYFAYVNELNDPSQNAVFLQDFTLPPDNQTTCIEINYVVTKSSYYFLTASTPGNIYYNYSYDILTLYYNRTDYDVDCSVLGSTTCDISLPFGFKEYTVLAYIHPLADSDPLTTHICLQSGWSSKVVTEMVIAVGAIVGAVSLLMFVVTQIYLVKLCCSYSYRKGYVRIGVE